MRGRSRRRVLATQLPRRELGGAPPLNAPRGSGSFWVLRASGSVRSSGLVARTRHRFTSDFVETRWTVRGARDHTVDVLFPSWGRSARLVAGRHDGSRVVVGRRPMSLAGVAYLQVVSERSGYVIVPRRPAGVTARSLRTKRQSSAPQPGPTLALRLPRDGFAARLAPTTDAAAVAARLHWH